MARACPQCKTANPDAEAVCRKCGADLARPAAPVKGKRERRAPSAFRYWLYRTAALLLLVALAASQIRIFLMDRELGQTSEQLARARATIQQAIKEHGGLIQQMNPLPPGEQPLRLGLKLASCTVEDISFSGEDASVRIANPTKEPTQPFVRVLLFDADGQQIGAGNVVDYRTRSFTPGEKKTLTDRVSARRQPSYFLIVDRRDGGEE